MTLPSNEPELMYTDDVDIDTDEAMVEEMYLSTIQRHTYHVLNQGAVLNIYGEPTDEPVYTAIQEAFPLHIKLSPEDQELNRYGYDRKRDAILWFCSKILRDRGISPKIGDRVDFVYLNASNQTVVEQLIITQISDWDFVRQAKVPYQITACAERTHKRKV